MIELLCTVTGILSGLAVVASLYSYQGKRALFQTDPEQVDADKIRGITDQLRVISHSVAANVTAHNEKVEHINGRLGEPEASEPATIISTIEEIIKANESMQGQLLAAQKRIAQQSEMIEHASRQARTDALTGLPNRRALDEFLANCIDGLADNEQEQVGLLLLDIDHFKSFNDSFGHATGDAVLASFARSIAKGCGNECYAARFGGEEFAVILTGGSMHELSIKSAKIRQYISEQVINYEDLQLKLTASAGMCVLLPEDSINSAYERADAGLFQAKKSGRNCGYWLGLGSWTPFPTVGPVDHSEELPQAASSAHSLDGPADELVPAEEQISSMALVAPSPSSQQAGSEFQETDKLETDKLETDKLETDKLETDKLETDELETEHRGQVSQASQKTAVVQAAAHEVLDLNAFLGRLNAYVEQLRRAALPATAIMIQAADLESASGNRAWTEIIQLILSNLRGIDVVCQFRALTLCVFLPGCSQDAALDRAAKIQYSFRSAQAGFTAGPSKLSIALASYEDSEEVSHFLDRLECALEEAHDASETEVVVHSGTSLHFQAV